MDNNQLIPDIVSQLQNIKTIKAVVLGGSRASNTHRSDSDIDLGIYYRDSEPLDVEQIKKLAYKINDNPSPIISEISEWGRWVNGGAWLTIRNQRVDLLYRNLDYVTQIINDSTKGIIQQDFEQQPAYGFYSYTYCAEISICKILYDPFSEIKQLKEKVRIYPHILKEKIVNRFLWDVQFTLEQCKKSASRSEVFIVAGCLTRIASDLVQVLYALNETYYLGEKRFYKDESKFNSKPTNLRESLEALLSCAGNSYSKLEASTNQAEQLFNEFVKISDNIYQPKYS